MDTNIDIHELIARDIQLEIPFLAKHLDPGPALVLGAHARKTKIDWFFKPLTGYEDFHGLGEVKCPRSNCFAVAASSYVEGHFDVTRVEVLRGLTNLLVGVAHPVDFDNIEASLPLFPARLASFATRLQVACSNAEIHGPYDVVVELVGFGRASGQVARMTIETLDAQRLIDIVSEGVRTASRRRMKTAC